MRKLMLITGASAGIGASFARAYAARGWDLALTARRADRLEALAAELKTAHGATSLVIPADLAERDAPVAILAAVADSGRVVDGVVNNAGYGLGGTFATTTWAEQAMFIQVMVTAVAELSHRSLGGMRERGFGRIINVASLAGILPGAKGHTLYAASKAFLIKMSQSMNLECEGTGVHVTALCPGFTYSEFHDVNGTRGQVSKMPKWMWQDADAVVAEAIAANEANAPTIVPGGANRTVAGFAKVLPEGALFGLMRAQSARFRKLD
ncbi:MAG: SDR family oxidoreductase [Alphaproteobacteria bacterium]|nr:SDR family oxidoreductase [Alphaproteobacteria bacterium]